MRTKIKAVRITLAVILALGLSLTHACAAMSSLRPSVLCKASKSINHQVDHVKKTSCKMLPCKSGQGRALLSQESVERRDTKGSSLLLAAIPPGQFETTSNLAGHGRVARTDLLHPPPNTSPPIYIKHCSLLR
jgi:hypothetical protein